jgi:SAM-dependent methyltransferase
MSAASFAQPRTRGRGLLEPYLARWRAAKANALIPAALRQGAILDIGCGRHSYFLATTAFAHKFALDQLPPLEPHAQIEWLVRDLNEDAHLPFEDGQLSVITLLAVAEHLHPHSLASLLREAHRALHPGGRLILTTPAGWTAGLLAAMARYGLLSRVEIDEHVVAYTPQRLRQQLQEAGFAAQQIQQGSFELGMNLWAQAER